MFCTVCGAELAENSKYCGRCGSRVDYTVEAGKRPAAEPQGQRREAVRRPAAEPPRQHRETGRAFRGTPDPEMEWGPDWEPERKAVNEGSAVHAPQPLAVLIAIAVTLLAASAVIIFTA